MKKDDKGGKKKGSASHAFKRGERNRFEQEEVRNLEEVIAAGAPMPGTNPLAKDTVQPGSYAGGPPPACAHLRLSGRLPLFSPYMCYNFHVDDLGA